MNPVGDRAEPQTTLLNFRPATAWGVDLRLAATIQPGRHLAREGCKWKRYSDPNSGRLRQARL